MAISKKIRKQVYNKFNGKCAYTGLELQDDWQVDHVTSKFTHEYHQKEGKNNIDNLMPALRIVNHYKRSLDLEGFRGYMMTFHLRLANLPKSTKVQTTINRIKYMNTIAESFGISVNKPFNGVFYFEK